MELNSVIIMRWGPFLLDEDAEVQILFRCARRYCRQTSERGASLEPFRRSRRVRPGRRCADLLQCAHDLGGISELGGLVLRSQRGDHVGLRHGHIHGAEVEERMAAK